MDPLSYGACGAGPDGSLLSEAGGPATPLRVAIDVAHTRLAGAGVARATLALLDALRRRIDVEPLVLGAGAPARGARRRLLALQQDLLWHPVLGRRRAAARGARVYHCPLPRAPLTPGRPPTVVTVHDLGVVRYPDTLSRWNRWYSRATIRRVLRSADRIVAVSSDTADDLDHLLGVDARRVRVVPNGVDAAFFAADPGPAPVAGPYVLFVGTLEPRKNLARLVAAMSERRARGAPERLVLVGAQGWGDAAPLASAGIVAYGHASDAELRALYAGASCLVLPSLHEGFGLPVLEAMAAGCPVVAARAGALPEVCGEDAVLVDPLDPRDIARGIDEAIADGARLRDAGRRRAAAWTWDRSAALAAALYRELA